MLGKTNQKRWRNAQKDEKAYWNYWNSIKSKDWARTIKKYWEWYLDIFEKYTEFKKETKILEIGSGPDGIIHYLNIGWNIAIDPSMDYYISNFELSNKIKWIKGVGETLPFKDNCFDIVITTNTLDHVLSPEKVLSEIKRVLKKDSFLFLTTDCYQPLLKYYRNIKEAFSVGDELHPYSFSVKDITRLIQRSGLQTLSVQKGLGDLGNYIATKFPHTFKKSNKELPLLRKSLKLWKEEGIITLIDAGISKLLRLLWGKLMGEQDKVDFIFIATKK